VAARVNDLLSRMSLDEKLGQMPQAERVSVTGADISAEQVDAKYGQRRSQSSRIGR
jgi:beta-glucosidase